jgi:uncharacterized Zn finger protein
VQRGNELHGFCEASSQPEPYHVRVTLGDQGVIEASCTCQYDFGGDCKHIVALLLTYLNKPGQFEQRPPIAESLASRDKDSLIALIHKMIDRYPDLEALIDLPVPGQTKRNMPVDTTAFRKQMRYALRNYGGWGDRTAESTVNSIIETAGEFADKGDWRSASAIYRTVIDECIQENEYPVYEDEGEFGDAFNEAIRKLGDCLEKPDIANDDQERQAILDALLSATLWDTSIGGYGLGNDAPDYILRHARQPDIAAIRGKVKAAQQHNRSEWAKDSYSEFLIELDALDNVDPDVILARLREEEMYSLLVRKLIEMGRIDEAVAVVENDIEAPYDRIAELPHLVAVGRDEDAIRIAQKTLQAGYDSHVAGWLLERYKARGEWEPYLQLQHQEMLKSPAEHNYVLLKEAAEKVGQWPTLRVEILHWLENKKHFDVLTKVNLREEEWSAAWETLDKYQAAQGSKNMWHYINLDLEVAQRSQKATPGKAIPVFIKYARWHISQRDRKHYQIAADFLSTVRDLYLQVGNVPAWQQLIAEIRSEFPSLRALQDELQKAGL